MNHYSLGGEKQTEKVCINMHNLQIIQVDKMVTHVLHTAGIKYLNLH